MQGYYSQEFGHRYTQYVGVAVKPVYPAVSVGLTCYIHKLIPKVSTYVKFPLMLIKLSMVLA